MVFKFGEYLRSKTKLTERQDYKYVCGFSTTDSTTDLSMHSRVGPINDAVIHRRWLTASQSIPNTSQYRWKTKYKH